MNRNQKIAFWSMSIGFCFTATGITYQQGAFENIESIGGAGIFVVSYLVVAFFIRRYVLSNPEKIDEWFQ